MAPQSELCRYNASDVRHQHQHAIMTPKWKALLNCKMQVLYDVLALGYHAFWMDGDSVLLANPLAVLPAQFPWAGSCTERTYQRHPTTKHYVRGDVWDMNTGVMWLHNTPSMSSALSSILALMLSYTKQRRNLFLWD
eukprot:EG_transcript_43068